MMDYKQKGLYITERDIELFDLLFRYKTANAQQVLKFIYSTSSITNVRHRLKRLESLDLIKSDGHKTERQLCNLYHLTKKGFGFLKEQYGDYSKNFKLKSDCPNHDLQLVEIGKKLEKSKHCEDYIPENILQSDEELCDDKEIEDFVKYRSDAYLAAKYQEEVFNVAIEYENTPKRISRYETIVDNYYFSPKVDIVFCFYRSENVKKHIVSIEEKNWKDYEPKFHFCSLKDFSNAKKKIVLEDRQGEKIEI